MISILGVPGHKYTLVLIFFIIGLSKIINKSESSVLADLQSEIWLSSEQPAVSSRSSNSSLKSYGFFFDSPPVEKLNPQDKTDKFLIELLQRNGPDIRSSRESKNFDDVDIPVSIRAWKLFRQYSINTVASRVDLAGPKIFEILESSNVSSTCRVAVGQVLEGAMRMDSWAIKMLNSWGNFPPVGVFEGTYSDIGSYFTCLDVPKNNYIDHAHFCTMSFRPVLPSRDPLKIVLKREDPILLELFKRTKQASPKSNSSDGDPIVRDAFEELMENAHYNHFMYYKWGTCWPIGCSPFDVHRITKYLGRLATLVNGPVKCYSNYKEDYEQPGELIRLVNNSYTGVSKKLEISVRDINEGIYIWKPFFSRGQMMASLVLGTLIAITLSMTTIDLITNKAPKMLAYINWAFSAESQVQFFEIDKPITNDNTIVDDIKTFTIGTILEMNNTSRAIYRNNDFHDEGKLEIPISDGLNDRTLKNTISKSTQICHKPSRIKDESSLFGNMVTDWSLLNNIPQFFTITEGQLKNDILCLNGIRCLTMAWIILTHTMLFNEWASFGRTKEVEKSLNSLIAQPLFNGSYLVDTFFTMSGLLSGYTAFKSCKGSAVKFRPFAFIINRWLRLTPQVVFSSMVFIVLPFISSGIHWYPLTGEYQENCVENWWMNLLHIQAFFKTERMCNFVTWWVSVDSFFHVLALFVILIILFSKNRNTGLASILLITGGFVSWQGVKHYRLSYPPNILSTIPQTGKVWTELIQKFYWTPYSHSVPFFYGLYIGYLMAMRSDEIRRFLTPKRVFIGWTLSTIVLSGQSYSTYWWVTGKIDYARLSSTLFQVTNPILWTLGICWIIVACHYGHGGFMNEFLSSRIFIVLGKASYLVFLTHFQVMFLVQGNQNLLIEPTELTILGLVLVHVILATVYGIALCVSFELPWLKMHKKIMRYI